MLESGRYGGAGAAAPSPASPFDPCGTSNAITHSLYRTNGPRTVPPGHLVPRRTRTRRTAADHPTGTPNHPPPSLAPFIGCQGGMGRAGPQPIAAPSPNHRAARLRPGHPVGKAGWVPVTGSRR